jgi:hypothetical protein
VAWVAALSAQQSHTTSQQMFLPPAEPGTVTAVNECRSSDRDGPWCSATVRADTSLADGIDDRICRVDEIIGGGPGSRYLFGETNAGD